MINEKDLIKYAKKNKEGFTVKLKNGKLIPIKPSSKNRYVVANRTLILYDPNTKTIKKFGKIASNKTYGGWYDKSSGKYFIETNNLYSNLKQAQRVGKLRRQKAIFDLKKMNEVALQYPKGVKVTGINPKRIRNVVIKKGKRYYNKITKKYTTEASAKRLNKFFKEHPDATLYEAYSQPKYKQKEKWERQSSKILKLYKKTIQVVKTKDRFGNDVFYSPILKKTVTKEQMKQAIKYDYNIGRFKISLFRLTADRGRVYHIIKYPIHRIFSIDEPEAFELFKVDFMRKVVPQMMSITTSIAKKHPLHKYQLMYVVFNHEYYLTNYNQKESGAVTVMKNRRPTVDMKDMPGEIARALKLYSSLISEYSVVNIKDVFIYIYSFSDDRTKALSEERLGVFKRNGNH
jgi:hypothetical protein